MMAVSNATKYEVHPAASIFPLMTEAAMDELVKSIREDGQLEPIVVWQGYVLDGRNRLEACRRAEVDPLVTEIRDEIDPVRYVLNANLHRRHLVDGQRVMIAARMCRLKPGRPTKKASCKQVTAEDAADRLQVSVSNIDRARYVLRNGQTLVISMVEQAELPVGTAERFCRYCPSKTEQKPIAEQGKKAILDYLREQQAAEEGSSGDNATTSKQMPEWVAGFKASKSKEKDLEAFVHQLSPKFVKKLKELLGADK